VGAASVVYRRKKVCMVVWVGHASGVDVRIYSVGHNDRLMDGSAGKRSKLKVQVEAELRINKKFFVIVCADES